MTLALALLTALAACTVGPDYQRPDAPVPAAYKEASDADSAEWKPSHPQDDINRGAWWSIYGDPVLDDLEAQVLISNQNLKAAEAAFRQANALVAEAQSGLFPVVTYGASAVRQGQGSTAGGSGGLGSHGSGHVQTLYNTSLSASWVPDIWGKVRRQVESDVAAAQASAADLASATLSAQATLAIDYFELRTNDATKRLLEETVDAFTLSLQITQNRYRAGTAAKTDVVQAQSQLEQTRAQLIALGVQRAQLEHAIAVLVGKPPADFSIAPAPLAMDVPDIPTGVPSGLLERRPDIASAERKMAAANAQIGVAIGAYYPDLTLSGSYGFSNTMLSHLLQASSNVWAFGPQLAGTLFDFGARSAQVDIARAGFDQTVADYRQTVLSSFQQVEDQLAALRILALQAQVQDTAVRLAEEAERLTLNQYKAGTVSYTSVITAQTTALADKQTALGVQQGRLVASVTLVEALGGGWSAAQLSDRE